MAKKRNGKLAKSGELQRQLGECFNAAMKQYGEDAVLNILSQKFDNVHSVDDVNRAISSSGRSLGENGLGRFQQCLKHIDREFPDEEYNADDASLSVREQLRRGIMPVKETAQNDEPDGYRCA
ncbi:MAG: hypothetical protein ACRBDL_03215 [Alphaproteobacteria bacterium]